MPLAFLRRAARRSPAVLFAISIAINIGMWIERFVIVVASLAHEYDSYSWGRYWPTAFEWTVLLGSVGWFLFWFLLIIGHIPSVPMAETKEHLITPASAEAADS